MSPAAAPLRNRPLLGGLAVAVLTALPASGAEVYRWTDGTGQVHYTDRAPTTAAERMTLPAPPPADPSAAERRRRRERLLRAYREEREERAAERARAEEQRRRREHNCALARQQRYDYEHAGYLYDEDAQGNRRILGDEEHRRALEEARAAVTRWCGRS